MMFEYFLFLFKCGAQTSLTNTLKKKLLTSSQLKVKSLFIKALLA